MNLPHPSHKAELTQIYSRADYWIDANCGPLLLKVGTHSDVLDRILKDAKVTQASLLTAFNPGNEVYTDAQNQEAQGRLGTEIEAMGLTLLQGVNADPLGNWPDEKSLLVFDLAVVVANAICIEYGQAAFLSIRLGKPVELVFAQYRR